jgi:Spy/CpxP family protein refolding chaperone
MKKVSIIILMVALPALLLAQPHGMSRSMHQSGSWMGMEQLNLSDEQADQLHTLRIAHQKKMVPLRADLQLAQIELDELVRAGDSSKKLDAAIKKVNDLEGSLNELRIKHQIEVDKVLTEEQRRMMQMRHADCRQHSGKSRPRSGTDQGYKKGNPPMPPTPDNPE